MTAYDSGVRAAAARYDVGVATAIRWARRWRQDGTHTDPPRSKPHSKLDAHACWLAALRAKEPELSYQAVVDRLTEEHGERFHETTLWYWLRRNGVDRRGILTPYWSAPLGVDT